MPVAAITAAATVGGAVISSNASDRSARAAQNTATQNNALQESIFNQQRADLAPWRASGELALKEINRRLGLGSQAASVPVRDGSAGGVSTPGTSVGGNGVGRGGMIDQRDVAQFSPYMMGDDKSAMPFATQNNVLSTDGSTGPQVLPGTQGTTLPGTTLTGTSLTGVPAVGGQSATDPQDRYGGFYSSPGYQFRFDEGQRGINANRAASGSLQSGDAMRALTRYGQDYASNEFNTQLNQLFSVAGLGQTATGQGNALAGQYGAQVGQNNQNASNALQSSYGTQANTWSNALGNLGGNLAYNWPTGGGTGGQSPPSDLWGLF